MTTPPAAPAPTTGPRMLDDVAEVLPWFYGSVIAKRTISVSPRVFVQSKGYHGDEERKIANANVALSVHSGDGNIVCPDRERA